MIHPTAIVEEGAVLGKNVSVGPYSVINNEVEIDDGTIVEAHVVIKGPTKIGRDNHIYSFASLGGAPQHTACKGENTLLEIADRNIIREFCTLNRGSSHGTGKTTVGSDNYLMAYAHVAHDCVVGNNTIFANNASLAGHVEVGDYVILGGFTGIHQFCRVGAHVMTGIATISFKDIPPYLLASGNTAEPHGLNTRGLKSRGFSEEAIDALKKAYKTVYRSGLKLEEAIAKLEPESKKYSEVEYFRDFLEHSERGIIR